jgi:Ca2+-transporting ATPase
MEYGLSTGDVIAKQRKYGKNTIVAASSFSAIGLFLAQFPTLINGILLVAAGVSFFISDIIDSIFIVAVILLNAIIGFIQEYKAEKSLEKLKGYTVPTVRVVRNNKELEISSIELVPGDLVLLGEGDRVPADGSIVISHHLESDESLLTGESVPVMKAPKDTVYMGMLITKGSGKFVVEQIGMETKFGKIAATLSSIEEDRAPLQTQIDGLGKIITFFVITLSLLIIPFGFLYGHAMIPLLLIVLSICVSAIPESLPVIITIALALGTTKMAKRKAIVRKMPAVETLGAIQYILVDKTGTLTQNTMRVKEHWLYTKDALPHLLKACVLGNTASLIRKEGVHHFDIVGDKTDGALLLFADTEHEDIHADVSKGKIVDEFVFDTEYKTITTVWQKNSEKFVYVRGAPEAILSKSTLSDDDKKKIEIQIETFANKGLRVIAFGSKKEHRSGQLSRLEMEEELQFLGVVGIYDPPRPEVKNALQIANRAGIRTIMVTGDSAPTALAIAKEIGLIDTTEDVITGDQLAKLTDAEILTLLPKIRIFARSLPEDKLRLVTILKNQGFVVGVTGDGVNDSLALKKADVGVAMGKSGTEVAKEASDMIIADDNFATLINAVIEGRTIYRNIITTITYLLASNFSELFLIFFTAVLNMPIPLYSTQILWINLITDGLPALALATDKTSHSVIKQQPRDPRAPILTKDRAILIMTIALGLCAIFLITFISVMRFTNEGVARTVVFNVLILSHITVAYLIRGKFALKNSGLFLLMIMGTTVLQLIITLIPELRTLFHLEL